MSTDFQNFSKIHYYLLDTTYFLSEEAPPHTYPAKKRKYPKTKNLHFFILGRYNISKLVNMDGSPYS
ncbi:hypothetical protein C6353_14165 [Bacillus toyonensis]|nr:hypothetical protein C6353_14165 [Bacillus toyonensis]